MAPGTSYRFVIEAFNSTSVADSSPVTLTTLAAARPLDQVIVWESLATITDPGMGGGDPGHRHHFG